MVQSTVTDGGQLLIIPGTYVTPKVISNTSNTVAAGVLTLIGEADSGPDWTLESDLNSNSFAPDAINSVLAKYGSGRLVDAFRTAIAAANDPAITGGVSAIKMVKTNVSTAASNQLVRPGFGNYASLTALLRGVGSNMIQRTSAVSVPEVAPTSGPVAYMPHYSGTALTFALRANGGAPAAVTIPEFVDGVTFCSDASSVPDGIMATGGAELDVLTGLNGNAISCAPTGVGQGLIITVTGSLFVAPQVGQTLVIPLIGDFGYSATSAIIGASNANRGSYIITAVNPSGSTPTITCTRINAPSGAPSVAAASGVIGSGEVDVVCYTNVAVQNMTGQDRQSLVGMSGTFVTTVGSTVLVAAPANWTAQPVVGDLVTIPSTWAGVNAGFYQVLSSTANSMTVARLSNGPIGSSGSVNYVSPITQSGSPIVVRKPVIDGVGKTLSFEGAVDTVLKNQSGADAGLTNSMLLSASEYVNEMTITQNTVQNSYASGGNVVLSVACSQESASVVVGSSGVSFKVGSTVVFSAPYAQFNTMNNLVSFINTQSTFRATLVGNKYANQSPQILDEGTYTCSSQLSANTARIKQDATAFVNALSADGLVAPENEQAAPAGLPEPDGTQFLAGGAKGGTSSAQFVAAIDACEVVDTNFMVPLVSADASVDIANGDTDPSSTYTVDGVNTYLKSHVIMMSTVTSRKNRIAIESRSGTYAVQKAAAETLASFRVGLCFQDVNVLGGSGNIEEFQPWMTACVAAGMQAAAGYKGIVKKFANVNGIVSPAGDFNASRPSDLVDALTAGLLILERVPTGGFRWVSDQMTYSVDNNFVYNSLQAVYLSDLITLQLIAAFDGAIIGQSVADISANAALSFLAGQMSNFLRLRWIAPSADGAPKGYKNASANINGGVLNISVEVKLAGLIYFCPINLAISQVQQSAS